MTHAPIPRPQLTKEADLLGSVMQSSGKVAPFLARSLHGLTGWFPGLARLGQAEQAAFLSRIGAGEHGARAAIQEAEKRLVGAQGEWSKWRAQRAVERARAGLDWAKATGGTIPGTVAGAVRDPRKVFTTSWKTMGPGSKALLGYFGYTGGRDILQTPDWVYGQPGFPYKSRLQHVGSELGTNLMWAAGAPLGFVPSVAGLMGGSFLGGLPGRLAARPPAPVPYDVEVA